MPVLLKIILSTILIQSFVLSTAVKGLTIASVSIIFQFIKDITLIKNIALKILFSLLTFAGLFGFYQSLIQIFNLVLPPNLTSLDLISGESPYEYFIRNSVITQSIYLFFSIIFYLYIYNYLKSTGNIKGILKFARIGVIFFILYGFYEFSAYLIWGKNMDFLSNRITGDNYDYGLFQQLQLGGFHFVRMKSLSGEPSMFAFSVLPFMILFYYLKDKTYIPCFLALLCSTSTTAVAGIFFFLFIDTLFFRKTTRFTLVTSVFISIIVFINLDIILSYYKFFALKVTLADQSGQDRFGNFYDCLMFFLNADPLHFLFGHGFGLIRSTDGISALLINNGLIGTIIFLTFFIFPVFKLKHRSDYRIGISVAMIVLILCMLISVPEFYFYHTWLFAALLWYEVFKDKNIVKPELPL
jgi:hypothetical protein